MSAMDCQIIISSQKSDLPLIKTTTWKENKFREKRITTRNTLWQFGGKSRASHGNSPVFPHFWLELQGKFEENVTQKYNFSYLINFSQVYQEDYAYPSICELSSWFLIPHGECVCTARTNLCTRCTDQCFHFRWQILYRKTKLHSVQGNCLVHKRKTT